MAVRTVRLRIATTNAPESFKKGLLRDKILRATKIENWAIRRNIDIRAIQEGGTFAEQIDVQTPLRKVLWAKANTLVKGRRVGNGLDVNRRRWRSRLLDDLTVGDLHIAVVLITERRPPKGCEPLRFKVRAIHRPTRRAKNAALRDVIDDVIDEQERIDNAAGMPWIDLGDMNDGRWGRRGVELGKFGPDHIRASKHFEPLGQRVVRRHLLSDHHFLIADTQIEVD